MKTAAKIMGRLTFLAIFSGVVTAATPYGVLAADRLAYSLGEDTTLVFSGYADIGVEYIFSNDRDAETGFEFAPYAELNTALEFRQNWSIQSTLKAEEFDKRDENQDNEGYGLALDKLFLQYVSDRFIVYAGKFAARFGLVEDANLGKYGGDFNDYEVDEKVGFGGSVKFDAQGFGQQILSASIFAADTSVFSDSLFFDRGRLRRADGGPSNTGDLSSYAIALDGRSSVWLPANLSYHVGFSHQAAGQGDVGDSESLVLGLQQTDLEIVPGVSFQWIAEVAHVTNFEGDDEDITFYTFGGTLYWNLYSFTTVYSPRHVDSANEGNSRTDQLLAATLGYQIYDNTELLLAYRYRNEEDVTDNTVSLSLGYSY
ncbi:MAG: hypothetical protein ACR2OX_09690 [Methyloligellaceae bacterium]